MMSFKKQQHSRHEPVVDMHRIARDLDDEIETTNGRHGPEEYAPLAIRERLSEDAAVQQVATFGALPTRELDDIVAAAEQEGDAGEVTRLKGEMPKYEVCGRQ